MKIHRRKRRRCLRCHRFVGLSNTTEYRLVEGEDAARWCGRKKYSAAYDISLRACDHCGRRGLRFIQTTFDRLLRAVYVPMITDLLNTELPFYSLLKKPDLVTRWA